MLASPASRRGTTNADNDDDTSNDKGVRSSKRKRCCGCSVRGAAIACGVTGVVFLVLGLVAQMAITALLRSQIKEQLPLSSTSSQSYDTWSDTNGQAMYMVYTVFNVTNADDVEKKGHLPVVAPVGPFTYYERRRKFDIEWSADDTRVRYKYDRSFHLIDERCNGRQSNPPDFVCTEDDSITVVSPNVPLQGVVFMLESMNLGPVEQEAVKFALDRFKNKHGETLFLRNRSVRELLFGYTDALLEDLNKVVKDLGIDPYYTLQRNSTVSAQFELDNYTEIYTGKDDYTKTGKLVMWAGQSILNVWEGCGNDIQGLEYRVQANMINGTEGIVFQPLLDESDVLQVFTEDLLRSSDIVYTETAEFQGIDLYRYKIVSTSMQNAAEYPPNCGFFDLGPSGVLNLTCVVTAPVFGSKPLFFQADPYYRSLVHGLGEPNEEDHDTYLDIEPWTGAVMRAHQRLQINVRMQHSDLTGDNLNATGFYLPIMWADEQGYISADLASQWKNQVGLALKAEHVLFIGGVAAGSVLLLVCLVCVVMLVQRRRMALRKAKDSVPLLPDSKAMNYKSFE
eukprot:m.58457 g.58457  ORF g.58457 m.58457 type:complete len:566 (-) comp15906_c0_seq1:70-1767(-)